MQEVIEQIEVVEVAAQVAKRASLMNAKTAAVNLGDETLKLIKLLSNKLNTLEENQTFLARKYAELENQLGGNGG
ncbi:MAG: hypothetical protein CML20_20530 [Rheinheimera sp.]|nr:hypothetical protein [Rheinheimera sp.]|tara:strand:- start:5128 stop:5352 length:225 start_codon:yes stop_codon:yes gene_type:complete